MQPPAAEQQHNLREPLGWFALAFALYLAYGAGVFYRTDGPDLLWLFHEGRPHPWHVGYLPLLSLWQRLLALLGLAPSLLRLGTSFSALGMAAGVALFAAGMRRLGVAPARRTLAAALLVCNPAAMLFATVVEFHGPLLGACGLAFWWTAVQVQRPGWWGMLVLGALTHGAFLLHSSALLLPGWLLPFWLARRWPLRAPRHELLLAGTAGLVHAFAWLLLPRCWPAFYGVHADFAAAYAKETSIGRPQSLDWTGVIFLQEWFWPLLPVSLTCFVAALRRPLRAEFAAFALGLLPFLYLCVRQLVFVPENGAYLLPLVPAAALLTVAALPLRALVPLAALSAGLALSAPWTLRRWQVGWDDAGSYARFVGGLEQAAAGRPFLALICRHDEMAIAYARLVPYAGGEPQRDFFYLRETATMPRAGYEAQRPAWIAPLRRLVGAGCSVLVTAGTREFLRDPAAAMHAEKETQAVLPSSTMAGPLLLADLEAAFAFAAAAGDPGAADAVFALRAK